MLANTVVVKLSRNHVSPIHHLAGFVCRSGFGGDIRPAMATGIGYVHDYDIRDLCCPRGSIPDISASAGVWPTQIQLAAL